MKKEKFNIKREIEEIIDPKNRSDLFLKLQEELGFSQKEIAPLIRLSLPDDTKEYNSSESGTASISESLDQNKLKRAITMLIEARRHPVTGLFDRRVMEFQLRRKIHEIIMDNDTEETILRPFSAAFQKYNDDPNLSEKEKLQKLEELRQEHLSKMNFTAIAADATRFKRVNDEMGHEEGNEALQMLAHAIEKGVDSLHYKDMSGNIYHVGGDEFNFLFYTPDHENSELKTQFHHINDWLADVKDNKSISKMPKEEKIAERTKSKIVESLGFSLRIDFASIHISYAISALMEICLVKKLKNSSLCGFGDAPKNSESYKRFYPLINNIAKTLMKLADRKSQIQKNLTKLEDVIDAPKWMDVFIKYKRGFMFDEVRMREIIENINTNRTEGMTPTEYLQEVAYEVTTGRKYTNDQNDDMGSDEIRGNKIIDRIAYQNLFVQND